MDRDPYSSYPAPLYDPNSHKRSQPSSTENVSSYEETFPRNHYSYNEGYYSEPVRQQQRISGKRPDLYSYRLHTGLSETPRRVRSRNFGTVLVSSLLYIWAMTCSLLGIVGILFGTTALGTIPLNTAPKMLQVAFGFILIFWIILNILLLVVFLIFHKRPHIRWWLRLFYTVAATAAGIMAIYVAYTLVQSSMINGATSPQEDIAFGSVFLVYAVVVSFIALY